MAFTEYIKETFESGDPTVRTWPLVHSYWAPFICSALYVLFVKRVGPILMRNREPFDLRIIMIFYNFSIVFVYAACLLTLVYNFLLTDAYKKLCTPTVVVENDYTYKCAIAGWYIYCIKYVEFADTVFFVLRKKFHLITNLHVIHHAALPIIGWILMRTETSGFQFLPGGLNSFIHIIMYTYYGLAAMGPEIQKRLWWKEYLTLLQMAQFVIILLFVFVIVPLSGCKTTAYGIYIDIVFATLFLALFYNFYSKTYKATTKSAAHANSNGINGVYKESSIGNGVEMKER